jgi:site-specific DNA-cytosine methylase
MTTSALRRIGGASGPDPLFDLVAGGFPCQPFSKGGRRRGTADERWGWPWFRAVVRAVRPEYVLVENVAALLDDADAFGWMLGDLAEDGFDADWTVLSACALGAPHMRDRLFLVAYPAGRWADGPHPLDQAKLLPFRGRVGAAVSRAPDMDRPVDALRRRRPRQGQRPADQRGCLAARQTSACAT